MRTAKRLDEVEEILVGSLNSKNVALKMGEI